MTRLRRAPIALLAALSIAGLPACSSSGAQKKVDKAGNKVSKAADKAKKAAEKAKKDVNGQ